MKSILIRSASALVIVAAAAIATVSAGSSASAKATPYQICRVEGSNYCNATFPLGSEANEQCQWERELACSGLPGEP